MTRFTVLPTLTLSLCFVACTNHPILEAKPEARLAGKWEEVAAPQKRIPLQFEFFTDGTDIENDKILGKWRQLGRGASSSWTLPASRLSCSQTGTSDL